MKLNKSLIIIIPFFSILLLFLSLGLIKEDNPYSIEESRTLAQLPAFDTNNIEKLSQDLDDYSIDQFPYRSHFLKYFTKLEILQGKKAVRNAYIADDEWIFAKTYIANFNNLFNNMEEIAAKYGDKDFYYFVLPVKNYSLPNIDSLIVDKNSQVNLDSIYSRFEDNEDIKLVDIPSYYANNFSQEEIKKFWFRADFHWNALGASEAVYYFLDSMHDMGGTQKFDKSMVEIKYIDRRFQGDLNRRFSNFFSTDEPTMVVSSKYVSDFKYYFSLDDSKPIKRSEIISRLIGNDIVDYNGLYTLNLPFYRVSNPNAIDKSTILILKDSLQNPTTEIFSTHFQQVIVVDARYEMPYSFEELADISDTVIIMLHQNNPSEETAQFIGITQD